MPRLSDGASATAARALPDTQRGEGGSRRGLEWLAQLPRLQLVELEDLAWWPSEVRDLATDALHYLQTWLGLHRAVVPLLSDVLRRTGSRRIVDLCSGAGGLVPVLISELQQAGLQVEAVLTDRYPNLGGFERAAKATGGAITFEREAVDAREVPPHLSGVRTLFNGFHHFPPDVAAGVLRAAREAEQPIAIFEFPDRRVSAVARMVAVPLLVWLTTPFIRPFRWRRLLWTYLIPLVPLTCFWDGVVSQLRAYRPAELEALAARVSPGFCWQVGRMPVGRVPGSLTYMIGVPKNGASPPGRDP